MKKHANCMDWIHKAVWLLGLALLATFPARANLTLYNPLTRLFDQSDFALVGNVSNNKLVRSQGSGIFPCGNLLTIENAIIHRKSKVGGKVLVSGPMDVPVTVAVFAPDENSHIETGKKVFVVGKDIDLSQSTGKPDGSGLFSPANPYVTANNWYTDKDMFFDCSAIYPKTLKHDAIVAYGVTTYQSAGHIHRPKRPFEPFDVVSIRREVIPQNPYTTTPHVLDTLLEGLRGWETADGHTVLCLLRKNCVREARSFQVMVDGKKHDWKLYKISGNRYFFEVDALFRTYDAFQTSVQEGWRGYWADDK